MLKTPGLAGARIPDADSRASWEDVLPEPLVRAIEEAYQPIPQNPKLVLQRDRARLDWNLQTIKGAYDRAGKKDPRWDDEALKTLEAAARHFSREDVSPEEVFEQAERALAAGCDDPMVLYVRARASGGDNFPGDAEYVQRHLDAARALQPTEYPAFRKGIALYNAAKLLTDRSAPGSEQREEAIRMLDDSLALMPESVEHDERTPLLLEEWTTWAETINNEYRRALGDLQEVIDRLERGTAEKPELRPAFLKAKAKYLIEAAWEVRGTGVAQTVTPEGWKAVEEDFTEARKILEEA
ncbi:hypothetical protein BH23PLA1_BH23PLA1_11980 [soil metagenome]